MMKQLSVSLSLSCIFAYGLLQPILLGLQPEADRVFELRLTEGRTESAVLC